MSLDSEELPFTRIYDQYFPDVYAFLRYLTKDPDEAEDLCQEVFLRYFAKYGISESPEVTNAKALLLRIAKNLFLNSRRRKGRFISTSDVQVETLPDNSHDFVTDHDWREYIDEISSKLRSEKDILAVIFVLRIVNGYSFREIANICGKTTRTIRRYMVQIKKILKK